MATVAALPDTLREKISAVAAKMARLRLLRRAAWSLLMLAGMLGLILFADQLIQFGMIVRLVLLGGWVTLLISGVGASLRSLNRQADVDALAALIESQYPNLAERLLSSVELAEANDGGHGSPALINLLIRETEIRASKLDFLRAAPERGTFRLGVIAAGVLAVVVLPSTIWPHAYMGEVKRVFLPWVKAPLPYEVIAKPGDVAVARGRPVTLSAVVQAIGPVDTLPRQAILVMTDASGKKIRLGMKNEQSDVYYCQINSVTSSFLYHVEAGEAVGNRHQVIAVDPVQLVGDSPTITITPPAYARKAVDTKTLTGLGDFAALQFSRLEFAFRFSRPAKAATLRWSAGNSSGAVETPKPVEHVLTLSEDGLSARFEMPAMQSGRLAFILEAEHRILTELPPQLLTVTMDRPPMFVKAAGPTEQVRTVNSYETVTLDVGAADDFGVESAELEYRINDGNVQREPIKLEGAGSPLASAKHALRLGGKVKEGDSFQYRLRITDNRRVPEAKLEPHVVYHPAEDRWFSFKIARNAEPLKQQEILAQRDDLRKRLEALIADLKRELRSVAITQSAAKQSDKLLPEPAFRLQELRKDHQTNDKSLSELAHDVALTPAMSPLANRLQEVSDQEMRNAAAGLQKADREKAAAKPRDRELQNAYTELERAITRLENLKKENDQLAQQRLDEMKLQQLAEREQQLAERAATEKDPQKAQELAREQAEIANELKRLTEQSTPLRDALNQAQAEANNQLADKARELAQAQRELAQATSKTQQEERKQKLADLAKQQKELAEKAARLAEETRQPVKAAQTRPLDPEKPKQAAEALDKGDPHQALTKQEQTAQDLDKLGTELDRAVQLARDPREAAKQLARLQDDLKNRTANEARKSPLDKLPADKLADLQKDQQAIQHAAENLSVPPTSSQAVQEKNQAAEHAAKAAEQLRKKNQGAADAEMTQAKQALERLADRLPTLDQRLTQAKDEIGKLKQQQGDIARQAEQVARNAEANPADKDKARRDLAQKLADSARKQADVADKLAKMDVPNQEARQQRTVDALNKALDDLLSARPQDVPATQQQAKRELERLEQALHGMKPVDERAADLARQQQQLAKDAARLASEPPKSPEQREKQLAKLQADQRDLARESAALPPQDAPQRHSDAAEATKQAERASRDTAKSAEFARRAEEAAQKLQRLADQLAGRESDAAKADRLAKRQADLANDADRLTRKPDPAAQADVRRRQQQVQDEAKQIRGGDEAAQQKQQAADSLARLSRTPAAEMPDAQRKAADALKDLADRLNKKPIETDPLGRPQAEAAAPTPEQLARQQRELAQQTQQAKNQAGDQTPQKAQATAEQLARQQQQLNQQAARMPANNQPKAMEQARQAMNQAERALVKGELDSARQKQQEAAKALDQLAQQPAANRPTASPQASTPANLPSRSQVEQARQLAREQRELRDAVQKAVNDLARQDGQQMHNPVGELTKEQRAIAEQAQQLAQQAAQQQGQQSATAQQAQQAARSTQQASNQMQSGALPQAQQSGHQAAQQLQKLSGNDMGDRAQQARELAQRQNEVNRQLERLANDARAQTAQQQAQQQNLNQRAQQLTQQMQQQTNQTVNPNARNAMQQATQASQQGQQAMQQAQQAQRQGNTGQTQQAQQQAAHNLDRAAQLAQQAAQIQQAQGGQPQPGSPQRQTGQSLQQAQNQIGQAQQQLGQGQPQQAQGNMQNAAQALQQAVQAMQQQQGQASQPPTGPSNPVGNDGSATGAIDLAKFGPDAKKYLGKPWGDLPGELRTRIIQDFKAQFGDDYGRMIKLYFEQLADKK